MYKFILVFLLSFILLVFPIKSYAKGNSFVSIVNPIRGQDFWELKDQQPQDAVAGQLAVLKQANFPATWLVRFDALRDAGVLNALKSRSGDDEIGLFLEVTPSWAQEAGIPYRSSEAWHAASSAFLTGYFPKDRERLIDSAFTIFQKTFGFYPQSVGAWYIDSYSLGHMQKKYGIKSALIVADQHTTDSYQVWGQYWSTPYYPSKKNTLLPAQDANDKLPLVIMQWAARDPVNGYGKGVEESTYSVQSNDYIDYHNLNINYFSGLVDIYTTQKLNQFGAVVIGLENSYSWKKYQGEYQNQINTLLSKSKSGQFSVVTMTGFADWYKQKFTDVSPPQIIVAPDPLGTENFTVWFMNSFYRAGWFFNKTGSVFRDVRPYVEGREEQCFSAPCDKLNFATFALWTIDEITRDQKLVLDPGAIKDIRVVKQDDNFLLVYRNEVGRERKIEFKPRDISVDGIAKSVDSFILQAISGNQENASVKGQYPESQTKIPAENLLNFSLNIAKFFIFLLGVLFIPGFLIVRQLKEETILSKGFLSISLGMVSLTLISYLSGYLKAPWIVYSYLALALAIFFIRRYYHELLIEARNLRFSKFTLIGTLLIVGGTIFQSLAMVRSGWTYDFGLGFWGPLGHDGIWHQALIKQLMQQVPPQNPGFSGSLLSNYHYFYDLLIAASSSVSAIPVLDLLYRFYPILFSLGIGLGTYFLVVKLSQSKIAALISVYFIYFAGSFGWIVEFLREKHFGGESAFWANQPVSANLNPPFAASLVLIIALLIVFLNFYRRKSIVSGIIIALIAGSLIEFKVYGGVIVLGGLVVTSLIYLVKNRDHSLLKVIFAAVVLSLVVFLPQNSRAGELLVFSPFWFIHSMVDFSDRVGWERLSLARQMGPLQGNWFKFYSAEALSLVLFIVGNLGTRFLALFSLTYFIKKGLWRDEAYLLIFTMTTLSLIIPILFIQKGNPWNTIQFLYYFIYFIAIFTGSTILFLWKKLPRRLGFLLMGFILLITPVNAVVTFQSYLSQSSPSRLTAGEYAGLKFLQELPVWVVLTYPFDKSQRSRFEDPFPLLVYETSSYVAAFSGKPTFIEDEIQQEILQNDYKKRLVAATDFFKGRDPEWSHNFLQKNNIRYIYLPKIFRVNLNAEALRLKKVYENEEVEIYETAI